MIDMYTHARIEGNEGMYVHVDMDARHFIVNVLSHTGYCRRTHLMRTCVEANTAHIQVVFDKAQCLLLLVNVLRHTGCCRRTHMMKTCIEANTDICAHIQVIFDKAQC